jgi:hypothetical protein
VGITRVTDIRTSAKSKWFHKPARGEINYAWILEDVRKLQKPIPCKGALGLWEVPESIVAKIRRQCPCVRFENEHAVEN